MICTVARLIHRVPEHLRQVGADSLVLTPAILAKAQPNIRAGTPREAAWQLIDPEQRLRQVMLPVPIAYAKATGRKGAVIIVLGIDLEGALSIGWRDGKGSHLVRPADGGLNDPVMTELDHLLGEGMGLQGAGPRADSFETIRRIHAGLVPEIVHREVPKPKHGDGLTHPWHDDVFEAIATAHGADQRSIKQAAPTGGRRLQWNWIGEDPRDEDETPMPGCLTGLPPTMPHFSLGREGDEDVLRIAAGGITYHNRSGRRAIRMPRNALPETVWTLVRLGMTASDICDMPGLDRYVVDRIEDEGELTEMMLTART